MPDETHVATIQKNHIEELRIGRSEYRGHHLVNCRLWANYNGDDEPRKPTKKGFALAVGKAVMRDVAGNEMTILDAG